ncbi:MAG: hypothetical protein ACLPWS_19345 [Rhodomicrobium sp.]
MLLSDVRVTFSGGSQADLIKKAYPLGPYIIGGFFGSVKIGFSMLESLRQSLRPPPNADPDGAWDPAIVANSWGQEYAAPAFASFEENEKKRKCTILLVGLSSGRQLTGPRQELTRVHIIRLSSPDFRAGHMRRWFTSCHIGTGGKVRLYKDMMRHFFRQGSPTSQFEMGGPAAWATVLGSSMGRLAEEHPTAGISPHVHMLVCRGTEIFELTNDKTSVLQAGVRTEFRMPKVAISYAEFLAMCAAQGYAAEAAEA